MVVAVAVGGCGAVPAAVAGVRVSRWALLLLPHPPVGEVLAEIAAVLGVVVVVVSSELVARTFVAGHRLWSA